MIMSPVDQIAELFDSAAARDYLGEPVTVAAHLLQAGALARAAGAPAALVAAALLHDVGHLRGADPAVAEPSGRELMAGSDNRHGERGAAWLAQWFGEQVTEPVRLHVAAKRYLCAAEPSYFALLSQASVYTLSVQGGPMSPAEAREFEALPYAAGAVAVRRWDDQAKDPSVAVPGFEHFRALLGEFILNG
ncbi:HD domain-containing protein [Trebonia sp.]|uniref:HD domain-containing protein n=1 Tax=Trebonia sp. TaxID=2767075 RepID=UPI0026153A1C|nr:HD domain-containing protein [Trebonia sp.]